LGASWSPSRAKDAWVAWNDFMSGKAALPPASTSSCATGLERKVALQRKLRVQGTPAILFPDNSKIPGY